jgi:hypothetical protein
VTNEERLEAVDLLERERVAVHLLSHGAIEPDERLQMLGLVVAPALFASGAPEQQ